MRNVFVLAGAFCLAAILCQPARKRPILRRRHATAEADDGHSCPAAVGRAVAKAVLACRCLAFKVRCALAPLSASPDGRR